MRKFTHWEYLVMKIGILAAVAAWCAMGAGTAFAQAQTAEAMDKCEESNTDRSMSLIFQYESAQNKSRITKAEAGTHQAAVRKIRSEEHTARAKTGGFGLNECNAFAARYANEEKALKVLLAPKAPPRWEKMLGAIHTLATEGAEVKRITADEWKVLGDTVAKTRAYIKDKAKDGLTEAEEDSVDNLLGDLTVRIAAYMSDPPRKAAAAAPAQPAAAASSGTTWVAAVNGAAPSNAVVGGTAKDGKPHYVCRMKMADGQLHPGKSWNNNCYVSYAGAEIKAAAFEVLVQPSATQTSWVTAVNGAVPAKAVESGGTAGGAPLYICRSKLSDGALHPGKIYKNRCYVGFGGKELTEAAFDALVSK